MEFKKGDKVRVLSDDNNLTKIKKGRILIIQYKAEDSDNRFVQRKGFYHFKEPVSHGLFGDEIELVFNEKAMLDDMQQMITLISAYIKKGTPAEDLLNEWKEKYFGDDKK